MYCRFQNDLEINAFDSFVCKCRFRENHCFFLSKINVFEVWSYQKSNQNRVQNTFEKKVIQKSNFEWIWGAFLEVSEHQSASKRLRKSKLKNIEIQSQNDLPGTYKDQGF